METSFRLDISEATEDCVELLKTVLPAFSAASENPDIRLSALSTS